MPPSLVITNPQSSSLTNPCPPGTGIGYGDWNGTLLVLCDPSFYKEGGDSLALALGLGLGIPALILCLAACLPCIRRILRCLCPCIKSKYVLSLDDRMLAEALAKKLHLELSFDYLSQDMKYYIMKLYEKNGDSYMNEIIENAHRYKATRSVAIMEQLRRHRGPLGAGEV